MKAELVRRNGVTQIQIDGSNYPPLSFKSFRPSPKNISDFYEAGVRLFCILSSGLNCSLGVPYSLFGESWVGPRQYDFSVVDRQIELFLQHAPEGYFTLMLQVDTRPWYISARGCPDSFTHLSQIAGDEEWRDDAADYLKAVLRHVESRFGERMYGYFLLGGMTTEWFSHADREEPSPSKAEGFLQACGYPVPGRDARELPENIALVQDETLVAYRRFHNELIADTILFFAREARTVIGRQKLLGVYFGYLFELGGPRLWNDGHIAFEKVFCSPDIDMISSPSSYEFRKQEDPSAFMVTYDTLAARNKLYYLEFDHITHLSPQAVEGRTIPGWNSKLHNEAATLDVMRRDFMLCCTKGAALWWFDMFDGWFASPGMMAEVKKMVALAERLSGLPMQSAAEIAVIADGESLYRINKNAHINTDCLGRQREGLARMGAPYDLFGSCDLESGLVDFDKYTLIVFLNAFEVKHRGGLERLKAGGRSLLWVYGPNLAAGPDAVSEAVGMQLAPAEGEPIITPYGRYGMSTPLPAFSVCDGGAEVLGLFERSGLPALARKSLPGYISYFSASGNLPGAVLREIARAAGVHIYSEDDRAPVYADNRLIGVYMPESGGILHVKVDGRYEELFSGEVMEVQNNRLTVEGKPQRARLYLKL